MNDLTFGALDRDGALAEALEKVTVDSRADFSRTTLIGSAALLAALSLPERAGAAPRNDIDILNYALTLEYLQAAFYTETERAGAVRGKAKEAARLVGAVERAHVKAFRKALGSAAVKRPSFNFRGVTESQTPFLNRGVDRLHHVDGQDVRKAEAAIHRLIGGAVLAAAAALAAGGGLAAHDGSPPRSVPTASLALPTAPAPAFRIPIPKLLDETHLTSSWSTVVRPVTARAAPSVEAAAVTRLRSRNSGEC